MPNQGKPDPNEGGRDQYKRHIDGDITVRGQLEVHAPPDSTKADQTDREHQKSHRNKNYIVSLLTLIFVIIYAGVAAWQACLTRESVDNNAQQFQIDQRPYLWDSNIINPANVKIVAGQRMWINISLINFGKAPALQSRGIAKIFIGSTAMKDADDWFAAFGEKTLPADPNETGIVVPPGIPSGEVTEKSAFGGGGYFSAMSDKVLTQDDVDYILHSNETIAIVVHTQYFDAYGTRYWSNFCLSRFDTGAYPNCKKHNEIH